MDHSQPGPRPDYKKGIYILPNLFTTLSLYFGFSAIIAAIGGAFGRAAYFIIFAALCDALDGTVARMTNTTSKFGVEYDSLCDLVSFGVAPGLVVYLWALSPTQLEPFFGEHARVGLMVAFLFTACGALRLARFNVFSGVRDPGYFQGLPIPGGAVVVSSLILWHYRRGGGVVFEPNSLVVLVIVAALAYLMVSNLDYISHKNKAVFRSRRPFDALFLAILILAFIAIRPKSNLLPLALLYLASGPLVTLGRWRRRTTRGRSSKDSPQLPAPSASPSDPPA